MLEDLFGVIILLLMLAVAGGAITGAVFLIMWHLWMVPVAIILVVLGLWAAVVLFDA